MVTDGVRWSAEERIRSWEPTFPNGTDLGFIKALAAQTPRAWVTPLLVGLNAAAFLAMTVAGVDPWSPAAAALIRWGANYGPLTTAGQPWRLLTSAFLHFGALHIVLNMSVLWQAGFLVERLVGNWAFLAAYLLAAVCSSVASLAWNPYIASAGASGAVFGVYGVFAAYLLRSQSSLPQKVLASSRRGAMAFLALNIGLGVAIPGIDLAGHLGGLLAGFVGGLTLARPFGLATSGGAARRAFRLLIGGAAVGSAAFALIPRTFDLNAEMAELGAMQKTTSELYESAQWRRQLRELSDAEFLTIVDEQVRPPWREHLERLRGLRRLRGTLKARVARTETYMDLRERSWAKATEAVRTNDPAKAAASRVLAEEASELAGSIGASQD